jgi:hypothetical protein
MGEQKERNEKRNPKTDFSSGLGIATKKSARFTFIRLQHAIKNLTALQPPSHA